VKPEFSDPICQGGKATDASWRCSSEAVLGAAVGAVLFCALLGSPIWFALLKCLGKRNTWLVWSLTMAMTNISFFFVGEGDINGVIILAGLNGIPMGAKFLSDAILVSDVLLCSPPSPSLTPSW
jgi:Na+/melibiose symporter-like transporter